MKFETESGDDFIYLVSDNTLKLFSFEEEEEEEEEKNDQRQSK